MKEKLTFEHQIIFVSEMRNPRTNASSTQIMTKNLLGGFRTLTKDLVFIAVISDFKDKDDIAEYYNDLCDTIVFCKDITSYRNNSLMSKISMVKSTVCANKSYIPKEIYKILKEDAVLISHSPSIDAALICNEIKRKKHQIQYIQYWGDPLALSLITPKEYSVKRSIQRWIEQRLHKNADKIVYGTKSLYDAQMELFPEIRSKSISVEVCYNIDECDVSGACGKRLRIGYFGNYYSNIRDIMPFYEAAINIKEADFVIGGSGDIKLKSTDTVSVMSRIPQSEVAKEEAKLDVVICILNKVGVQIPGKVFYPTNTKKSIVVITDGPNKENIIDELNRSGRFVFCDNKKESIERMLYRIINGEFSDKDLKSDYYNPTKICKQILG